MEYKKSVHILNVDALCVCRFRLSTRYPWFCRDGLH